MGLAQVLYCEINLFCIAILLIVLLRIRGNVDRQTGNIAFERTVISVLILLALDCIYPLVDGRTEPWLREVNFFVDASYLFMSSIASLSWFYFQEERINPGVRLKKSSRILLLVPVAVLGVACAASRWTGWMCYIDSRGAYCRGPLYLLQPFTCYFILGIALVRLVAGIRRCKHKRAKKDLTYLLSFFGITLAGAILSMLVFGLPVLWPAASLSLLLLFVGFQQSQISTDGLTGLNNRRQFDNYCGTVVSDLRYGEWLVLLMLDIDHFKQINDTYGHMEGDRALVRTAGLLKEVCQGRDAFLARYGGDEFVILFRVRNLHQADEMTDHLRNTFLTYNNNAQTKYPIQVSVGKGICGEGQTGSVAELIACADHQLYQQKEKRHKMMA